VSGFWHPVRLTEQHQFTSLASFRGCGQFAITISSSLSGSQSKEEYLVRFACKGQPPPDIVVDSIIGFSKKRVLSIHNSPNFSIRVSHDLI
jgi:hypothetical protein